MTFSTYSKAFSKFLSLIFYISVFQYFIDYFYFEISLLLNFVSVVISFNCFCIYPFRCLYSNFLPFLIT